MMSSNICSFESALLPAAQNKHFFCAEVIESNIRSFVAYAWRWDSYPSFGSLVFAPYESISVLGCVTHIETGSLDPSRHPIAYQKTESELLAEQPQIFELLRTVFTVHILGYYQHPKKEESYGNILYAMAPRLCKIHNFVGICSSTMHEYFFQKSDYLHLLFASSLPDHIIDDLLIAIITHLITQKIDVSPIIRAICEQFPLFVGNDYRRMKRFLKRITPLI